MDAAASPLDRFIPHADVRERFKVTIRAPAELVMDVASSFDMQSIPLVRAIIRSRELLMGSSPTPPRRSLGIVDETRALGWGTLQDCRGRLLVCGARCQPWLAEVRFTAIAAEDFATYAEPGEVKIAWSLDARPQAPALTCFVQETRAVATDAAARTWFRRYWRWARFGIVAIRLLTLPAIRREAERRWRQQQRAI